MVNIFFICFLFVLPFVFSQNGMNGMDGMFTTYPVGPPGSLPHFRFVHFNDSPTDPWIIFNPSTTQPEWVKF